MKLSRRSVVKSAGVLSATLFAPNLPMWALADEAPQLSAPSDYIALSSVMIDVDTSALVPAIGQDNLSLADVYYSLLYTAAPGAANALLAAYANAVNAGLPPAQIADDFLRASNGSGINKTDVGTAARLTMMMWLFGIWYAKTETGHNELAAGYIIPSYRTDFVVSSRAYKNGWIWRFAQAHAMGVSHFKLGSWSVPPPSLSSYLNPLG